VQDLTFIIDAERPVAEIWETLGDAGIAMEAACAFPRLEGRVVHLVLRNEDVEAGEAALRAAGFPPLDRRPVLIHSFEIKPGELGRIARRIAEAGAKIYLFYMATGDRVVIGADDLEKVAAAL
jgi:hypothetical protein